jgi:DNA polymerase-3 subunit gamma/tau
VHLVQFETGRIEFRPAPGAPRDLANKVAQKLAEWTGQRWLVGVANEGGEPTLREQDEAREASIKSEAARNPLVRAVLEAFPGARIEAVREIETAAGEIPEPPDSDDSEGDELS